VLDNLIIERNEYIILRKPKMKDVYKVCSRSLSLYALS
jgi:hypothetical protein